MTASEAPLAGVRVDRRVMRLAALFVQPDGCYAGLPDVDAWPEARDARNYTGPLPVVAHPPCQLWGAMANVNYARWGGSSNPWRGTAIGKTHAPAFEEWVMGWPVQWTELTQSATVRFQQWQQQHSPC